MAVIVGSDGVIEFDLGGGMKCLANIFSWRAERELEMLNRTTLADEAKRRVAGLADWSGTLSSRLEFSDDTRIAQSSWQVLDFAINGTDEDLKADVELTITKYALPTDRDIFASSIQGGIWLAGVVTIKNISIDCQDPERPVIATIAWEGDGALSLERE